jgi:hypothetical protein
VKNLNRKIVEQIWNKYRDQTYDQIVSGAVNTIETRALITMKHKPFRTPGVRAHLKKHI